LARPGSSIIDLGHITFEDSEGKTAHRIFINECQTGIGSKVASSVKSKYKIFGGKLAFGVTATIQALLLRPVALKLEFDDEPVREFKLIGLVAGNGTECAGGMKLTPGAKLNDHLFDVLLMHEMSIPARLVNLPKIYSGAHVLSPHFTIKQCKKLRISSNDKQSIEADGEMLGYSPFEIEILPAALKIKTVLNNPI
jgi:diacylglycerol kinase (ATP)